MILVSGAGGKTGRALLKQLALLNLPARALVRRPSQVALACEHGAVEGFVADLLDPESLAPAFEGISALYHIPPNVHPQEQAIAENLLRLSTQCALEHFVFHSVLRPNIRAMPHHIRKARVEERLYASAVPFTILQPAAYMQNTLASLARARDEGVFRVPYPIDTPLGMVDLEEVAVVGAMVLSNPDHFGATYELAGAEILSPIKVAQHISIALGVSVEAQEVDLGTWRREAVQAGLPIDQIETLMKMFRYYARHGFWGNAHTLPLPARPDP